MPRTALRLAICVVLLAWIFHVIFLNEAKGSSSPDVGTWDSLSRFEQWRLAWTSGPAALWKTARAADPAWLAISVIFVGISLILGISRWRLALVVQGINLSWRRTAEISLVAHFFNSFLLGATGGDLIKAYYAARETRNLRAHAVVSVFADRLLGLFAMLAFAVAMMPLNFRLLSDHESLSAVALFILAMLAALGILAAVTMWGGLSRAVPNARAWLRKLPKGSSIEEALEICRPFGRNLEYLTKSFLVSALLNTACVLQVMAVTKALNYNVPAKALFLIVPSIICISALPITPSGIGVRENLYVLMLSVPEIGIPSSISLSISIIAFAGSLFWSLIGGFIYLFYKEQLKLDELDHNSQT